MMNISVIDTQYWGNLDIWPLVDASCLTCIIEPQSLQKGFTKELLDYFLGVRRTIDPLYGHEDLTEGDVKGIEKRFQILNSIAWGVIYGDHKYYSKDIHIRSKAIHPFIILAEIKKRGLSLDKELLQVLEHRQQCELNTDAGSHKQSSNAQIVMKSSVREDNNKTKSNGLMALLLAKRSGRYKYGDKVSAKKIKEDILEIASELDVDRDGLKSLDRDIAEGLKLLESTYGVDMQLVMKDSDKKSL